MNRLARTFAALIVCALLGLFLAATWVAGERLRCDRLTDPQALAYYGCAK